LLLTPQLRRARAALAMGALACAVLVLAPSAALAQRAPTRAALSRLEESLSIRLEEGGLVVRDLMPLMVVSVAPATEETRAWYPTEALASLVRVFGASGLRSCEACMAPRLFVQSGRLEQSTANLGADEIIRLDEQSRGTSLPARTALWLDETLEGVAVRLVDLRNSRIVYAENFDPTLSGRARTAKNLSYARELERRARGDSITHTFIDVGIYPGQHVSLDWVEQWGDTNANLSGFSASIFDPIAGVGGSYFRVLPKAFNVMLGAKVLMSVPTALLNALTQGGLGSSGLDPLLTGVLMLRVPIGRSNYGLILSVSTNGRVGLGFSLMNFSVLPFLP
jgi:hypothetical protein